MYCTHIFDGLEGWPTHLAYVAGGKLKIFGKKEDIPALSQGQRLMTTVVEWLREGEPAVPLFFRPALHPPNRRRQRHPPVICASR